MVSVSGARQFVTALRSEVQPTLGRQWPRHLTTDGQPCPEQLTQKPLAGLFGTLTTRPISHSHLTKRPAVARATAGKVLAGGCTRQGQSTRRGLSSPSMRGITSTTLIIMRFRVISQTDLFPEALSYQLPLPYPVGVSTRTRHRPTRLPLSVRGTEGARAYRVGYTQNQKLSVTCHKNLSSSS